MHRRLLRAAAAAVLAAGLVGCTTGGPTEQSGDSGSQSEPTDTVASAASDGGGDSAGPNSSTGGDSAGSDDGGDNGAEASPAAVPAPDPADYPGKDGNTPEGAEQAFRYYIAVAYWSYSMGDPAALDELDNRSCSQCKELQGQVSSGSDDGVLQGDVHIVDRATQNYEPKHNDIEVGYAFAVVPNRPGRAETKMVAAAGLIWVDDHWEVAALDIDEARNVD